MLRVGLTGDLASGKSTVAAMLAERGAHVFSSDEMARAMMQPGEPVYRAIVEHFGDEVLLPADETAADGAATPATEAPATPAQLDRRALAKLAFDGGRVEELNSIVHPAVIAEQARLLDELAAREPHAVAVVESALLLSTRHAGGPWHKRFDEVVVVNAPEELKVGRFVGRASGGRTLTRKEREALAADAAERLRVQRATPSNDPDFIILRNDGDLAALARKVDTLWLTLWRKATR